MRRGRLSLPITLLIFAALFIANARSQPLTENLKNFTITLPSSTKVYDEAHILCPPAEWGNIAVFFLGNYIAHAGTAKIRPAARTLEALALSIIILFLPGSGLAYSLMAISAAIKGMGRSDVEKASYSGALAMIVRTSHWTPPLKCKVRLWGRMDPFPGSKARSSFSPVTWILNLRRQAQKATTGQAKVLNALAMTILVDHPDVQQWAVEAVAAYHSATDLPAMQYGPDIAVPHIIAHDRTFENANLNTMNLAVPFTEPVTAAMVSSAPDLPPGYEYIRAPVNVQLEPSSTGEPKVRIRRTRDVVKSIIALAQVIYSISTLFETAGKEISFHGYASSSLTVIPYAVMGIVNLVAHLVQPAYETLYLVRNDVVDELEQGHDVIFPDVVGSLSKGKYRDREGCNEFLIETSNIGDTIRPVKWENQTTHMHMLGPPDMLGNGLVPTHELRIEGCDCVVISERTPLRYIEWAMMYMAVLLAATPFAILGGLTHYQKANSTLSQRGWLMAWLVLGQFNAFTVGMLFCSTSPALSRSRPRPALTEALLNRMGLEDSPELRNRISLFQQSKIAVMKALQPFQFWVKIVGLIFPAYSANDLLVYGLLVSVFVAAPLGTVAVGGFVVVGQMIQDFGNCMQIY